MWSSFVGCTIKHCVMIFCTIDITPAYNFWKCFLWQSVSVVDPLASLVEQLEPLHRYRERSAQLATWMIVCLSRHGFSSIIVIEEILEAYPTPYASLLQKQPWRSCDGLDHAGVFLKGASCPTINSQILVGFYQDTVPTKNSPRVNPQSSSTLWKHIQSCNYPKFFPFMLF